MDNDGINFHNIVDSIEDDYKVKKVKESILLLKRKMCKTNDLIKQYSSNIKEIANLKSDLEVAKKETKHTILNYKTAMDKIRELELKIVEDKQSNEKLMNKINEYEINIAADKQTIQQLTCKIKEMEKEQKDKNKEYNLQKSYYEDKIKDLECESKKLKATQKRKEKKLASTDANTSKSSIDIKSSSDIGINVSLCDIVSHIKPEVQDQCIMTDEFYNIKNDPHPLFCTKCEAHLPPDSALEKIYKTMTTYPKLIEKDLSPLRKKIYSPPCSLPSTYPGFTNRNEDALSKISSMPHMSPPCTPFSDSMSIQKYQSGRSSVMTQVSENIELRNVDISHVPVVANLPNNFSSTPTALTLSQNRNYSGENFHSDELTKHSLSIIEIKRKIQSLESKMKKFRKKSLKEKMATNSRRAMNHNDDISLNSNLISVICKGMAEYFNEKREASHCKNERDSDSEKCECCTKKTKLKRQQSTNKCNEQNTLYSTEVASVEDNLNTDEIYANDNFVSKNNVEAMDVDNQTEIGTCAISLSNNKNFTDHAGKINDIKAEESKMKRKSQSTHKVKEAGEIHQMDNQIEIGRISLPNNENSIDHTNGKIIEVNAEENELKGKSQGIHNEVSKIYTSDNLLSKDAVEAIDMDNQTETEMIALSNNENSTDHTDDKIVEINTEESEMERKDQSTHKDEVSEIHSSDNLLSKDAAEAIDMDNQTETEMIALSNNENSTDHIDGKIVEINAEKSEIERKDQSTHKDEVSEIHASDNLLSKDTVEAIDTTNQTETEITVLFNNKNSIDHTYGKIGEIKAKNELKGKGHGIHEDKEAGEIHASDNASSENKIENVDMENVTEIEKISLEDVDNQIEIETISLPNNINSTDHTDGKIVEVNAKENEQEKSQSIHEDEISEIHASDNLLSEDTAEAVDTDNQTEIRNIFLPDNENSDDDKIVDINADKIKIERNSQSIHKINEIYASNNLLNKSNVKTNMNNQTETGTTSISNIENSTDHADGKTADIKAEENEINRKGQSVRKDKIGEIYASDNILSKNDMNNQMGIVDTINPEKSKTRRTGQSIVQKGKVGDRLLKNIRNLKRKTREVNLYKNKQEAIEPCSTYDPEYNELTKRPRIENGEEISDCLLKSNLKRNLEDTQAESIIEQEDNTLCSDHYEPVKKLRIAHTPKTSDLQFKINENHSTHGMMRNIAALSIRRENGNQPLCAQKGNLLTKSKKNSTIKDAISNDESSSVLHGQSNLLEATRNGSINNNSDLSDKSIEVIRSPSPLLLPSISPASPDPSPPSSPPSSPLPLPLPLPSSSPASPSPSPPSSPRDSGIIVECCTNDGNMKESLDEVKDATNEREETCVKNDTVGIRIIEAQRRVTRASQRDKEKKLIDVSHHNVEESQSHNDNDVSDETKVLRSPSSRDSGIIFEDCVNTNEINNVENKQEEACINKKKVKKRVIKTKNKNVHASQQDRDVFHDETEPCTPMSQLMKYMNTKRIKKHNSKEIAYTCKITDKFVKKQLRRLINSAWEVSIHNDIIKRLKSTCGPRIIAKCVVEFLLEEVDHSAPLDKSFTPPAPLMTTYEQKIVALLFDLEKLKPTVIQFVQAAIEYHLFKLDTEVKVQVDTLTRIHVVLSRIQKDREKIRMICCDALYCTRLKAIGVLFTVLTCWPEVLPHAEDNKGILPKCIAYLIGSQRIENPPMSLQHLVKKLHTLKSLITRFYNYTLHKESVTSDIVKELMTALKAQRTDGLDTAIILIAKREETSWTYKNIIQSDLLPMIIKNEHPCIYSAFSLLGRLLRAFPIHDKDKIVQEITEQLCALIQSGQGSHDQQEGVISAMLSLSRHKFNDVALPIIKWIPSEPLRPFVDTQLQGFINARNAKFWKFFLQNKNIKAIQSKT